MSAHPRAARIAAAAAFALFLVAGTASLARAAADRTVLQVLDGDTLILDGGQRVRLLGVDAPEIRGVRSGGARLDEMGAVEARQHLEDLVRGRRVRLEQDWQKEDSYRRTLAYLYRDDGLLVNEDLLRNGLAFVFTRFPFERIEAFRGAEDAARSEGKGLWGRAAGTPPIRPDQAGGLNGHVLRVDGQIRRVRVSGKTSILVFDGSGTFPFSAVIYPEDRRRFPDAVEAFEGRWVRVTGRLEGEHGTTEVVLRSPGQIEVLEPPVTRRAGILTPGEAVLRPGESVEVQGRVFSTFDSGKAIYLTFGQDLRRDFRAVIYANAASSFPPDPARYYEGRTLRVRGIVRISRERAEMVLEDPSQIEVLAD